MGHTKAASALLFLGTALMAQTPATSDQPGQPHAWRRAEPADEQAQPQQLAAAEAPEPPLADQGAPNQAPPPPPPAFTSSPTFSQSAGAPRMSPSTPLPPEAAPAHLAPAHLTIRPGTFVTVRVNQWLSSDKNQQGDTFFASLAEPLIVDGVVVAQRGQTVMGRVSEARKAGRTEGTSRLGIELTSLTLVDGQQVPLQSQIVAREGGTSVGRDVAAVGTTTALGAIIGAGADYGRGAAIGAGAGAAAGLIGVLLTRGHATEVYPETPLTFRIQAPVDVATDRAPQAFRYAESRDYGRPSYATTAPRRVAAAPAPAPYYAPYYSPYYDPFYYGPSVGVYIGRPYHGYGYGYGGYGGRYYGRGYRR